MSTTWQVVQVVLTMHLFLHS